MTLTSNEFTNKIALFIQHAEAENSFIDAFGLWSAADHAPPEQIALALVKCQISNGYKPIMQTAMSALPLIERVYEEVSGYRSQIEELTIQLREAQQMAASASETLRGFQNELSAVYTQNDALRKELDSLRLAQGIATRESPFNVSHLPQNGATAEQKSATTDDSGEPKKRKPGRPPKNRTEQPEVARPEAAQADVSNQTPESVEVVTAESTDNEEEAFSPSSEQSEKYEPEVPVAPPAIMEVTESSAAAMLSILEAGLVTTSETNDRSFGDEEAPAESDYSAYEEFEQPVPSEIEVETPPTVAAVSAPVTAAVMSAPATVVSAPPAQATPVVAQASPPPTVSAPPASTHTAPTMVAFAPAASAPPAAAPPLSSAPVPSSSVENKGSICPKCNTINNQRKPTFDEIMAGRAPKCWRCKSSLYPDQERAARETAAAQAAAK